MKNHADIIILGSGNAALINDRLIGDKIIPMVIAGIAFICFMAWVLNRDFPPGLLQNYSDLPWPLGGP